MVKEGYWYGLPLVLMSGGLIGFWLRARAYPLLFFGLFFLTVALLVLNFFRDPERRIPSDPRLIVSPADGRVLQVAEEDHEGRAVRRVSIFMSPFDVHVNRAPIAGTIKEVSYRKGVFRIASRGIASVENEQNIFTVQGEQGEVIVKQIAGALARRIVFWKRPGDALARGERVGMIKFGSRVDVLVDPKVELNVRVGDRLRAGSSILGITEPNLQAG
jgi:phosphatidylserine decarboxylase